VPGLEGPVLLLLVLVLVLMVLVRVAMLLSWLLVRRSSVVLAPVAWNQRCSCSAPPPLPARVVGVGVVGVAFGRETVVGQGDGMGWCGAPACRYHAGCM
jgi:hypothetical protein